MPHFTCQNGGGCCGLIPVTATELFRIRRSIRKMGEEEQRRLAGQKREEYTCPLRDVENYRCSVYEVRPEICKMAGLYAGMECPNNPGWAKGTRLEGQIRLQQAHQGESAVGIMGIDFTWENLFRK